jgi:hypothetical protein
MPAPPKSWDGGVPADAILLSEAFARFYRETASKWQELENAAEAALASYRSEAMPGEPESDLMQLRSYVEGALDAHNEAIRCAEVEFRKHLAAGKPRALMRDPVSGENLALNRADWIVKQNFGVPGFDDDFVWTGDILQPGPDAIARGALRPVFFLPTDFNSFMAGVKAAADDADRIGDAGAHGGPLSATAINGKWNDADVPCLEKMRHLMTNREARSLNDASKLVASAALGGGTEVSKAKRLARSYPKWFARQQ